MATSEITPTTTGTGDLTTEKVTYRTYVKFAEDGTIDKIVSKAQVKDDANWAKLEKDGWTKFNQNDFIRYTVKSLDAAKLLIPDEKQLVYIFQAGLNYLQNSKANAVNVEIKDGTDTKDVPAEPMYNDEEIDLREAINTPPERKSLSPMEKLEKLLASFPPEVRAALMSEAQNRMDRQAAAQVQEQEG
jgi:hypothetical protein